MSFGKRMQACREELGISQLALARQIGVSQSTIGQLRGRDQLSEGGYSPSAV